MTLHQLKNFTMFRNLSQPLRGQAGRFQTSKRRHYFLSTLQSRDCLYRIDTKFYIMKVERDNCLRLQWEVKTNDHWLSFLGYHFNFNYSCKKFSKIFEFLNSFKLFFTKNNDFMIKILADFQKLDFSNHCSFDLYALITFLGLK